MPALLDPEICSHLAVHRSRGGQILLSLFHLTDAAVELPKAEMAVGDKEPHSVQLSECKRLSVVPCGPFGI
jgi:hypothetical protein